MVSNIQGCILLLLSLLLSHFSSAKELGMVTYWGQNVHEGELDEACATGNYEIVDIAFLSIFGNGQTPDINLSRRQTSCCLWTNFLYGHQNNSEGLLGNAILHDIAFGIKQGGTCYYDDLAKEIDSYRMVKDFHLSAAPQCAIPDPYLDSAIQTALFDHARGWDREKGEEISAILGGGEDFDFQKWGRRTEGLKTGLNVRGRKSCFCVFEPKRRRFVCWATKKIKPGEPPNRFLPGLTPVFTGWTGSPPVHNRSGFFSKPDRTEDRFTGFPVEPAGPWTDFPISKLYLGLPASPAPTGRAGGYIPVDGLNHEILPRIKSSPNYGGVCYGAGTMI
ncbi:acidic endochitinase-like [Neltuma alba]|uniref:acidic endochitinase-like n=1 Tax=Neltuma alba TaxID=207710 RepID=UPI0010A2F595|nr:acidic endochitinase-like [Prosopis alba]